MSRAVAVVVPRFARVSSELKRDVPRPATFRTIGMKSVWTEFPPVVGVPPTVITLCAWFEVPPPDTVSVTV